MHESNIWTKDRPQILRLILNELKRIDFCYPWNCKKTWGSLMILEEKLINFLGFAKFENDP